MSLSTKEYFVRETYKSIRRNGLMSVASVSTVALSLLVLGMFLLLFLNTNNLAQYLESQVQITVYMQDEADGDVLDATRTKLEGLPGVEKVTPVTKEEALERFKERLGEQQNLLNSLGTDNPFPYYFEVEVDAPERIAELTPQIGEMEGVETAKFGQEVVEQLFQITKILRIGGILLVVLLAFATLFIIANTIRLTVFARRREVNIMKYVGATDWFIRWPFVIEGMVLGLVAGGLAFLAEWGLYTELYNVAGTVSLSSFHLLSFDVLRWWVLGVYAGAAALFGIGGSVTSIRKFMDV